MQLSKAWHVFIQTLLWFVGQYGRISGMMACIECAEKALGRGPEYAMKGSTWLRCHALGKQQCRAVRVYSMRVTATLNFAVSQTYSHRVLVYGHGQMLLL